MKTRSLLWLLAISMLLLPACTDDATLRDNSRSFIRLTREIDFHICKKKKKKELCEKDPIATWGGQGSGSVVAANSLGVFVLTAEHVCEDPAEDVEFVTLLETRLLDNPEKERLKITTKYRATSFAGQVVPLEIIADDSDLDTCILFAPDLHIKPLKRFYGRLTLGETYYNIAAPLNTFQPGSVPLLSGRFSGYPDKHRALFTIPAAGGSSGSPVIDTEGRLVGMIHSVVNGFSHVSFGPRLSRLNTFIDDNIEDYYDKWHKNMLELTRPKSN